MHTILLTASQGGSFPAFLIAVALIAGAVTASVYATRYVCVTARRSMNALRGPDLNDLTHDEYLLTRHWRIRRGLRLDFDNQLCQAPGCRNTATQVHHLRYPRDRYALTLTDLSSRCAGCHVMAHPGRHLHGV